MSERERERERDLYNTTSNVPIIVASEYLE